MQPLVFKAKPHGACLKSQIGLILFSPALPDGWDSVQGPVLAQPASPLQAANADSVSETSCLAPCGGRAVVPIRSRGGRRQETS